MFMVKAYVYEIRNQTGLFRFIVGIHNNDSDEACKEKRISR